MGFKKSLTFIFDVVNLTSTNIGFSSFGERQTIFNCVKQNSFKICLSCGVNWVFE